MFNTSLLNEYKDDILISAIQERQKEIVDYFYGLWQDMGDGVFNDSLYDIFPPGFIDRDKERAKQVVRDINNIVQSVVIRRNAKAIYCYVMHHMIEIWYNVIYFEEIHELPSEVMKLIEESKALDDDDPDRDEYNLSERIYGWFTDKEMCLGDFEDAYDEDFFDETTAEAAAELFLSENGIPDSLGIDIRELIDLLPTDLYELVMEKLDADQKQTNKIASEIVETIWPEVKGFYHVPAHSDSPHVCSYNGAKEILLIFKDWVENNSGWRDVLSANPAAREAAVQRLIVLGSKTYIKEQNLDLNCENNIGVGEEDIKISRGNDKTVIEIKLTSNPRCKHGYEKQLPRYAEAEHTDNMIFCLVDLGDNNTAEEIKAMKDEENNRALPELFVINARPQKSASVLN